MAGELLALAGGVGGAKLVWGLSQVLPPEQLVVVVNTADDEEFHGLQVSPDLDTVMYTLAGLANPETGWGITGDTTTVLSALERLGAPAWFKLGDRDLATHIRRTELLRKGGTLSAVTAELCRALGVKQRIVPMTDNRVRTSLLTDQGVMAFQEYFVKHRCQPRVRDIMYEGADWASPSPAFEQALQEARAVVYCPSNPFLSLDPILEVLGVRRRLQQFSGPRIAVSPIVGGEAVKGPAAKLFKELGQEPSALAVARRMVGLCSVFVLDTVDQSLAQEVDALGMRAVVADTMMNTPEDKVRLAKQVCGLASPDA
ncbi:MAG: 2-phospho-L-lactate transferase [Dehalococcoidia bacterium]|nr:2-phospho-L-lactate transferase [Dehalococcoidia bacterium]